MTRLMTITGSSNAVPYQGAAELAIAVSPAAALPCARAVEHGDRTTPAIQAEEGT